jgi:hypothetical protein
MNYPSQAHMSLHAFSLLLDDLKAVEPAESERTVAFKRQLLQILRKHEITCANMGMLVHEPGNQFVIGNGQTLFQHLFTEVPMNIICSLRDWMLRYNDSGYDYVAAWAEVQDFQDC